MLCIYIYVIIIIFIESRIRIYTYIYRQIYTIQITDTNEPLNMS